jgi:chemotaxis-related protein WspB
MSTRVILVRTQDEAGTRRRLGLVAEQVTGTTHVAPEEATPSPVALADAPFLGELHVSQGEVFQVVKVSELLPPEVRSLLFPAAEGTWTSPS